VDRPAQVDCLHKIHFLNVRRASLPRCLADSRRDSRAYAANLRGQAYVHHVACQAGALYEAQNALGGEPANGIARGAHGQVDIARQPQNRKPKPAVAFQVAMPQQVHIDHVVDHRDPLDPEKDSEIIAALKRMSDTAKATDAKSRPSLEEIMFMNITRTIQRTKGKWKRVSDEA
jgi:hypothetical protein